MININDKVRINEELLYEETGLSKETLDKMKNNIYSVNLLGIKYASKNIEKQHNYYTFKEDKNRFQFSEDWIHKIKRYKLIEHDNRETFILSETEDKEKLYKLKDYYDKCQQITQNNVWYSIKEE